MNKVFVQMLEQPLGVVLRAGRAEDAPTCGAILYRGLLAVSEQHGLAPDLLSAQEGAEMMAELLAAPLIYSVVAEDGDGRIVGSNFLWEGDTIAGIGPTSVDPAAQSRAVGRRVMENALERAREKRFAGVRLVQAAHNARSLSLYTKLGFDAREPLAELHGEPLNLTIPGHAVRPVAKADLAACNRLCTRVHGHDRASQLREAAERETALLVEREERITGYTTEIGGLGHAVGENNEDLKALIGAASKGEGFYVPMRNGNLFRWCLSHGLRVSQTATLMSLGMYNEPTGAFLPSILY